MPHDDVPEVTAGARHVEVLVWEEATVPRLRAVARKLGIPDEALHIVRPVTFLAPYPGGDARNDRARDEFLARNVRMVTEDSGVLLTSMPAVASSDPRTLILGSMPGVLSLRSGEYYAHPRNRFWRIVEDVFDIRRVEPYSARTTCLSMTGVALWDVLKHCSRVGSLDSSIVSGSEVPNDVIDFLQGHSGIDRVVFNGRKAARAFRQFVEPNLPRSISRKLRMVEAPSTSAANTRVVYSMLVEAWRTALR
jgi:TDG/mug DNA glycosylase family protein